MKIVLISNFKFIPCILLVFCHFVAAKDIGYRNIMNNPSYKQYFLDIDDDGDKDVVAVNSEDNDLFFFENRDGHYINIYHGENYLYDGIYKISDIKKSNDDIVINTVFNGSGAQNVNHYLSFVNGKWRLRMTETKYIETLANSIRYKICINLEKKDNCFYEIINKSYLYKSPNKKTKMYLIKGDKVTILDKQTDNNGQKWYFINYKGKKDLNMWIKAEALDMVDDKRNCEE